MSIYLWIVIIACSLAAIGSIIYTLITIRLTSKEQDRYFNAEKLLEYENKIATLLKQNKVEDAQNIRCIVEKLNYKIEETDQLPFYEEARFSPDEKVIRIRKDFDMMQQNFDLAHEVTHILCGDAASAKTAISFLRRKSIEEQITDYMAAAILIPADELAGEMVKAGYNQLGKEEKARFCEKVSLDKDVHVSVVTRRVSEVIAMGKYKLQPI